MPRVDMPARQTVDRSNDRESRSVRRHNLKKAQKAVDEKSHIFWRLDESGGKRPCDPQAYLDSQPGLGGRLVKGLKQAVSSATEAVLAPGKLKTVKKNVQSLLRDGEAVHYFVNGHKRTAQLSPVKAGGSVAAAGAAGLLAITPMPDASVPVPQIFKPEAPEMQAKIELETENIVASCKEVDQELLAECPEERKSEAAASLAYFNRNSQQFSHYNIPGSTAHANDMSQEAAVAQEPNVTTKFCFADEQIVGINEVLIGVDCEDLPMSVETSKIEEVQELVRVAYLRMLAGETSQTQIVTEDGTEELFAGLENLSSEGARDWIFTQAEAGVDPLKLQMMVEAWQPLYQTGTADEWNMFESVAESAGFKLDFQFSETGHYDMFLGNTKLSSEGLIFPKGKQELRNFEFLAAKVRESEQKYNLPAGAWWALAEKESTSGKRTINSIGAVGVMMHFIPKTLREVLRPDPEQRENTKIALRQNPMASLDLSEEYMNHRDRAVFRNRFRGGADPMLKMENLAIMVRAFYASEIDANNRQYFKQVAELLFAFDKEDTRANRNDLCRTCDNVRSGFGWRDHPKYGGVRHHDGIDLRAKVGEPIYVAGPGRVIRVSRAFGARRGYGALVDVLHADGKVTRYAHLSSINVHERQQLEEGAQVGKAGASGGVTGPHLHFEVRVGGRPIVPSQGNMPGTVSHFIEYGGGRRDFATFWKDSRRQRSARLAQADTASPQVGN